MHARKTEEKEHDHTTRLQTVCDCSDQFLFITRIHKHFWMCVEGDFVEKKGDVTTTSNPQYATTEVLLEWSNSIVLPPNLSDVRISCFCNSKTNNPTFTLASCSD